MSQTVRGRKRAVRLTADALERVRARVIELWVQRGIKEKLTREVKAELLGVSVATSERILAGRGVDRTTLVLAFAKLQIEWWDSCCEYCDKVEPIEPKGIDRNADLDQPASRPVLSRHKSPRWRKPVMGLGLATVLIIVMGQMFRTAPLEPNWGDVFHEHLRKGSDAFHAGDLRSARNQIGKATNLARVRNAGKELASSLRIAGDIAAAEGSLGDAIRMYREALSIRTAFEDDRGVPAILEAIGALETRTGSLEQSEKHLVESLKLYRSYRDATGVAMASRNLGSLAFKRGEFAKSASLFADSLRSIEGLGKPDIEMDVKGRQALVLVEQGRLDEARTLVQACLSYWKQRDHPRWIATTLHQLSIVEAQAGNRGLAIKVALESKRQFDQVGDKLGSEELSTWTRQLNNAPGQTLPKQRKTSAMRSLVPSSHEGSTPNAR